jgi:hypothetical protein
VVRGVGPWAPPERAGRWAGWLRGEHERSGGADGLVQSLAGTPNALVGLPFTAAGLAALERLVAAGRSAAIGPVLSVAQARAAAERHLRGLERRLAAGAAPAGVVSIAWCPVTAVDAHADARLDRAPELRGWVGSALAQLAYAACYRVFSGPRWEPLRAAGALRQRPAFTVAGDHARLALPGAVVALAARAIPAAPLGALAEPDETEAAWVLAAARRAGVDLTLRPLAAARGARRP